jgi:ribosomal protein S2
VIGDITADRRQLDVAEQLGVPVVALADVSPL